MTSEVITTMEDYIVAKQRHDKLRKTEVLMDVGNGPQIAVSSTYVGWAHTLQTCIDDLVVEHGYSGARKIVNRILDEVIQEHRNG